ncbi:MAG: GNAT family N-acetyltransferase [Desulfosarcinaceae bacterium]
MGIQDDQSMQVRLRVAEPDDEQAVALLAGQLGYPSTPAQVRRRLAAIQGREEHFVILAVSPENRPVGWMHAFIALRLQSDLFAEIGGMVVAEEHRGRGIGARLLAAAEDWARSKAMAKVRVRSNVIRDRTHGFYLDRGYRQRKTAHVFEKTIHETSTGPAHPE